METLEELLAAMPAGYSIHKLEDGRFEIVNPANATVMQADDVEGLVTAARVSKIGSSWEYQNHLHARKQQLKDHINEINKGLDTIHRNGVEPTRREHV